MDFSALSVRCEDLWRQETFGQVLLEPFEKLMKSKLASPEVKAGVVCCHHHRYLESRRDLGKSLMSGACRVERRLHGPLACQSGFARFSGEVVVLVALKDKAKTPFLRWEVSRR